MSHCASNVIIYVLWLILCNLLLFCFVFISFEICFNCKYNIIMYTLTIFSMILKELITSLGRWNVCFYVFAKWHVRENSRVSFIYAVEISYKSESKKKEKNNKKEIEFYLENVPFELYEWVILITYLVAEKYICHYSLN